MDSYQASAQFSQILASLTPSLQSLMTAARFALKNAANEDYLFPVILHQLQDPAVAFSTKGNIFQLLDVLIHESFVISQQPRSHYNYPYIQTIKQQLPTIIYEVLQSKVNLYNAYLSLRNISKHFPQTNVQELMLKYETQNELLTAEDLTNIENDVPFSEQPPTPSPQDTEDPLISAWKVLVWKKRQSRYERIRIQKHSDVITGEIQEEEMFNLDDKQLLSRQQITMRMESDRESHKRSKETLWIVNRPHEPNYVTEEEFAHNYWNKVQKMSSEEYSSLLDVLGDLNKLVRSSFKDNIA